MTGRATGQDVRLLNPVLGNKFLAFGYLLTRLVLLAPRHIKNLVFRSYKSLGISMARKAPLHLERRVLVGQRHIVDLAMAGRAAYAFVHVNAVIEVNVVREAMNPGPLYRLTRFPTL